MSSLVTHLYPVHISFCKLPVRFEEIEWTRGYGIAERPLALVIIIVWNILKDGIFDPGHMNMHMTRVKRAQAQRPLDRRNIHKKAWASYYGFLEEYSIPLFIGIFYAIVFMVSGNVGFRWGGRITSSMVMTFLLFHNSSGRIGSPGSSQ